MRSGTLLCVFLLLGIGIVTATAPASAPTTSCIKVDGCALDLITSVFRRRISLSTQCCQVLSTISNDCFYREFTHSKKIPFFLSKVRNYCSHAVNNAASPTHAAPSPSPVNNAVSPTHATPSPSLVNNAASPTHAAPSPSLINNAASPTHAAPSPSPADNAASPTHPAPSCAPAPGPTTSCIKVDGCAFGLITSVFKRRISLSAQCCQGLSTISDDCFYREFTYSKRVPFFLGKVRNYCSHH